MLACTMRPMPSVFICTGDPGVLRATSVDLARHGLTVTPFTSAAEAMGVLSASPPLVLVLDVVLPDADGRDVCQALRAAGIDAPVLFLSNTGTLAERLSAFHAGGDDYLAKPFATAELVARVGALGRRRARTQPRRERALPTFDPVALAVSAGDRTIELAPCEYRLLAALTSSFGTFIDTNELVAVARDLDATAVDASIGRLRQRLRDLRAPETIDAAAAGAGYRLR